MKKKRGSQGKVRKLMQLTMRLLNLQKTARESFFSTKASSKEHQKDVSEQTNVSDTLQIPGLSDDASLLC